MKLSSLNGVKCNGLVCGTATQLRVEQPSLAALLLRYLPRNASTLKQLDICPEPDGRAQYLANAQRFFLCLTALQTLDLSGVDFDISEWNKILDGFEKSSSLLSLNGLVWQDLVCGGLKSLELLNYGNGFVASVVRYLPRSVSTLTSLDLRGNKLGHSGWIFVMNGLDGCKLLSSINGIECKDLVCGGLKKLDVRSEESGFAISLVRYLPRSASSLTSLDIRSSELGHAGWAAVVECINSFVLLTSLNGLSCSRLFKGELQEVNLRKQEDGLAAALVPYLLRSATSLTSLHMRGNMLPVLGASWETIMSAPALTSLNSFNMERILELQSGGLSEIDLKWTEIAFMVIPLLPRHARTLTILDLRYNNLGYSGWAAVMHAIEGCLWLVSFNGVACRGLVGGWLKELILGPQEDGFASSLVLFLPRSESTLTSLDMRHNNLGFAGWATVMGKLSTCSLLTMINGIDCQGLISGGMARLHLVGKEKGFAASLVNFLPLSASSLTSLEMSRHVFTLQTGIALAYAITALKALHNLDLRGSKYIHVGSDGVDTHIPLLCSSPTDSSLNPESTRHSIAWDEAIRVLQGSTALKTFNGFNMTELQMGGLTELDLNKKEVGSLLFTVLDSCAETLTKINLGHNNLGLILGIALEQAMPFLTALTSLDLSNNALWTDSTVSFFTVLLFLTTLEVLDLRGNKLSSRQWETMADLLVLMPSLDSCNGFTSLSAMRSGFLRNVNLQGTEA